MGLVLIKWHAQNWISYNKRLERWQSIISWYTLLLTDLQKVSCVRHLVVYLNKITETKKSEIWETKLGSLFLSVMAAIKPWFPMGNIFRTNHSKTLQTAKATLKIWTKSEINTATFVPIIKSCNNFRLWHKIYHFIFCWPCIMWWFLVNDQRDAQLFSMYLFIFLTLYVFSAHRAHHQEREIVSIQPLVAVTLCRWPHCVQVGSWEDNIRIDCLVCRSICSCIPDSQF